MRKLSGFLVLGLAIGFVVYTTGVQLLSAASDLAGSSVDWTTAQARNEPLCPLC
ncbi:MAG TPA: hypothetical protein VNQ81_06465 [Povalibacter sp.]|nr:hypothetical protein [Povalibacter sp.]